MKATRTNGTASIPGILSAAARERRGAGLSTNEEYQRLQGNDPDGIDNPAYEDYLDVDQYISFLLANFYGGNNDWMSHNWYAGRRRGPESTGWKAYTWDAEWVLGKNSGVTENCTGDTTSSDYLLKAYTYLRNNIEFRMLFADYAHKAFFNGGLLYVDSSAPNWDATHPERNRPAAVYAELADMIEQAMITFLALICGNARRMFSASFGAPGCIRTSVLRCSISTGLTSTAAIFLLRIPLV